MVEVDSNATVTLEDVQFPPETAPAANVSRPMASLGRSILNSATNSGIIRNGQFNDGGLGDIGLQWRNVRVDGSVTIVHNTLSVDVVGTNTGPIAISDVAFRSGALDGAGAASTAEGPAVGRGRRPRPEVDDHATNSGVIIGGQFQAGGLGHVALQWRGVHIRGSVTVVDNVLSVKTAGPDAGPITISRVRYE